MPAEMLEREKMLIGHLHPLLMLSFDLVRTDLSQAGIFSTSLRCLVPMFRSLFITALISLAWPLTETLFFL
jgi:hypothetical protein